MRSKHSPSEMECTVNVSWVLLLVLGAVEFPAVVSELPPYRDSQRGANLTDLRSSSNSSDPTESGGCGGRIVVTNTSKGHIKSPVSKDWAGYPNNARCFWLVSGPEGRFLKFTRAPSSLFDVRLAIPEFILNCSPQDSTLQIEESCGRDKLTIHDVDYCKGRPALATQIVPSNKAVVNFTSDYSMGGFGFSIEIETEDMVLPTPKRMLKRTPYTDYFEKDASNLTSVDRLLEKITTEAGTGCGDVITVTATSPGLLRSPTGHFIHAEKYPGDAFCIWIVKNMDGGQLKIGDGCNYDKLVINGTEYCRENNFTGITVLSNIMIITFKTDSSVSGRGFSIKIEAEQTTAAPNWQDIHWLAKEISTGCGGVVKVTVTATGYMKSPLDGSGRYPANALCIWVVEAPDGMRLKFTHDPSSPFDIPEICRNGKLDIAGMEYCGEHPRHSLTIPFSKTIAIFQSDRYGEGKGFNVKVEAVEQNLTGEINEN